MNVFELLDELSSKPKEEIEFALVSLMLKKKIDFINVSNAYVAALKNSDEDKLNKLIEAESCVLGAFHHRLGGKKESDQKTTQRCLYLLNKSDRFNMNSLNEKYNYDEEIGKQSSWYEQNKRTNKWK